LLNVVVHRANLQDRDGVRRLLRDAKRRFPSIIKLFADAAYQGPRVAQVVADIGAWQIEIVKRTEAHNFIILPKRWIVERTFAWITRNRRLARDFERYASSVVAFIRLAMIRIMLRRLTSPSPSS
jgi:transposase